LVSHKAGSVRPIENLHYKNFKSNCIIFWNICHSSKTKCCKE
jgi:hypothetical protein